jgi:hypothetical protein
LDIRRGIERAHALPEANHAEVWRSTPVFWLRRCNAAQFVIVNAREDLMFQLTEYPGGV